MHPRRLGRRPPLRDARVPRLEDHVADGAAADAATIGWARAVAEWPMCLNDKIGSCTIAGVAHAAQVLGAIGGAERIMTDDEVVRNYGLFGYRAGNPATDQGAAEQDVLTAWLNGQMMIGGQPDRINAYATIAPANTGLARFALGALGVVYIGAAMPIAAQSQPIWDPPATLSQIDEPGTWGGHCMLLVEAQLDDHPDNLVTFVTWGTLQQATWRWWRTYCDEAHAVDHPAWTRPGSLSGLDSAGLQQAMALLRA